MGGGGGLRLVVYWEHGAQGHRIVGAMYQCYGKCFVLLSRVICTSSMWESVTVPGQGSVLLVHFHLPVTVGVSSEFDHIKASMLIWGLGKSGRGDMAWLPFEL